MQTPAVKTVQYRLLKAAVPVTIAPPVPTKQAVKPPPTQYRKKFVKFYRQFIKPRWVTLLILLFMMGLVVAQFLIKQ